jgi:glucose/arabinose dehydrogenase
MAMALLLVKSRQLPIEAGEVQSMSRMFHLLGAGVLALAVATSASAAPAQAKPAQAKPAQAKPAQAKAAKKPAAHSITGTLEKYDAAGNSIVVKTAKGEENLSLGSATSIRMGATRMTPSDLSGHTGQRVKVRYSEDNGKQVAQTVQFEGGAKTTAKAETTSKPASARK